MQQLKTFSELAQVVESEHKSELYREKVEQERERLERREQKQKLRDNAVVGGVYRPDPVDRAAAMLLARAPWWAFAPSVRHESQKEKSKMKNELDKNNKEFLGKVDCTEAVVKRGGEEFYDMDKVAACFIRHIEQKYPPNVSALARAMVEARGVLDDQMTTIGAAMDEFERVTKAAVQTVRSQRMTTVAECSSVVNALKDVRQFFLGPDYEREQKRLSEFVDLCERLKLLKDSGFLDTVADTMIRLASYDK